MKKESKKTNQYMKGQPFLPRYEVTGVVGEGAAAVVYRAVDRRDGAVRAIKALRPESRNEPSVFKRFEEEYKILRGLHHPSLPEVYDYGFSAAGLRYMVMDYVVGEGLDSYLDANPDDLWLLLYELNEVLTFIHEHGLLHQDLKPSNILVTQTAAYGAEKPLVMLMDFGLSYRRDVGESVNLVGTPEYMAPEVIRGRQDLTRAVDYYSMGITLYELLAGETPFRGGVRDVFDGHLNKEVKFAREKTEYADLYPHVLGLVAKDPNTRLEAFEDYRRSVAARIEGGVDELERAYGLGFISSIGKIGKQEIWGVVSNWLDNIDGFVRETVRGRDYEPGGAAAASGRTGEAGAASEMDRDSDDSSSFVRDLKYELLSKLPMAASAGEPPKDTPVVVRPDRVMVVSGAAGSGKTYLFEDLRAQAVANGRAVWVLGEKSEYEELAGDERAAGRPDTLGRFMSGWERLAAAAVERGAVLIVDGYERLGDEEREFVEYVKKRIDLSAAEDHEPSVFLAVSGTHPRLHQSLRGILPEGEKPKALVLTHPQKTDLEDIVDRFRGRTVSLEFGKQLFMYLRGKDSSAGAVVAGLKDALLKGVILFSRGQWQYGLQPVAPAGERDAHGEYYQALLDGLEGDERELLRWLSCHKGGVLVDDLGRVSSLNAERVQAAASALGPFRMIEIQRSGDAAAVELSSESVRAALYGAVDTKFRKRAHGAYIELYETKLDEAADGALLDVFYGLAYHYEQIRDYERLFRAHLRLIDIFRREARVYEMRELCARGIAIARKLRGKKWEGRRWHIERYYLKRWIEAEWSVNNYRGIRDIVARELSKRGRKLPVSFALKYGLSMVNLSKQDEIASVVKSVKKRVQNKNSVPYAVSLILQSVLVCNEGDIDRSNKLLDKAAQHAHAMDNFTKCRLYAGYTINANRIGNFKIMMRHIAELKMISLKNDFMNEYMIALFAQFNILFEQSKHQEAQTLARRAVSLAVKNRLYHRQRDWYFLSSAVYYEQGVYNKALKYIEKAYQLANNLGIQNHIPDTLTRIGMNYQNMGRYGDAIRVVKRATKTLTKRVDPVVSTLVTLFWFDLHLSVHSKKLGIIKSGVDKNIRFAGRNIGRGYYHFLVGQYYYQAGRYDKAMDSLERSRAIYEQIDVIDDSIRTALLEASACLEDRKFERSAKLIKYIKGNIVRISSKNIVADYRILWLKYHYQKRSSKSILASHLKKCEEAVKSAYEMKTLLEADKLLFRVKARLGRSEDAFVHFNNFYKRVKKIVANLPNREYAEAFVNEPDSKMIFKEYKLLKEKSAIKLSRFTLRL